MIYGKEIVRDLRSGMTRQEIMRKYGLSVKQLKKAFEIILRERKKVAEAIAEDVRSGMKDSELMEKYRLSNSALQKICQTLLTEGLLEPADIQGAKAPSASGASVQKERGQISTLSPEKRRAAGMKRRVKPAEFLSDLRAGLDDAGLMYKYGLSAHELLKVMSKLMWEGLMSATELAQRRSLAKTVYMPVFKCPSCKEITYEKLEKCPHCGASMKNLNEKKSDFSL
jgi:uncharacterized protein (DUF433 family)